MSKRKSRKDYVTEGELRGMTFLGPVPKSVRDMTMWECNICGRVHEKSLSAVRRRPCICRTDKVLDEQAYHDMAYEYSIKWIGNKKPKNQYEKTDWLVGENAFSESYHRLSRKPKSLVYYINSLRSDE